MNKSHRIALFLTFLILIFLPMKAETRHQMEKEQMGREETDSLLTTRFDSLVRVLLPKGANVALMAYDLNERRTLYTYQADKLGRPASNMKLLTTITALDREEADESFRTEVWAEQTQESTPDTLYGNLYVVGGRQHSVGAVAKVQRIIGLDQSSWGRLVCLP